MSTSDNMDPKTKASSSNGLFACFAMPAFVFTALWLMGWALWSSVDGLAMLLQGTQPWIVVIEWIRSFSPSQRYFAFGVLVSLTFSKFCISLKSRQTGWSHRLLMAPLLLTSLFFLPIILSFQQGELGIFSALLMVFLLLVCSGIDLFAVTKNLPNDNFLSGFYALWVLLAFSFSGYFGLMGHEATATLSQASSNHAMAIFLVALSFAAVGVLVSLFRLKEVKSEKVSYSA
jgi:hypothetical protein